MIPLILTIIYGFRSLVEVVVLNPDGHNGSDGIVPHIPRNYGLIMLQYLHFRIRNFPLTVGVKHGDELWDERTPETKDTELSMELPIRYHHAISTVELKF